MLAGYRKRILRVFADSFPLSAHYQQGRKLRKSGWEKLFPEIARDVESRETFLDAAEELEKQGVLSARWKRFRKGSELTALYLEDPAKLYEMLGETHPDRNREALLADLTARTPHTPLEAELTAYCIQMLGHKQPLLPVTAGELADILTLASCPRETAASFSLRGLSIHLFHNSKRIEQLLKSADTLCRRVCGSPLSTHLELLRKYPESTLTGQCSLVFRDGTSWDMHGKCTTLPLATIEAAGAIRWHVPKPRLLSVENKETFHIAVTVLKDFHGFLFTSGQLNRADQALIRLLEASGAALYHFGDLDPGGVIIFRSLYNLLDGKLRPWRMNRETYDAWLPYGYPLEPTAVKTIANLAFPPLQTLIDRILETGRGVEQEIIDLRAPLKTHDFY